MAFPNHMKGRKNVKFCHFGMDDNVIFHKESQFSPLQIELNKIIEASILHTNRKVETFRGTHWTNECARCKIITDESFKPSLVSYQILFQVNRHNATFEATVDHYSNINGTDPSGGTGNEFRLNAAISRIDIYGDQPKCVAKEYPHLRKFCFCKSFIPKQ